MKITRIRVVRGVKRCLKLIRKYQQPVKRPANSGKMQWFSNRLIISMTGSSCCRCCCCIGVAASVVSIGLLIVDDWVVVELVDIRLLELVVVVVVVVVVSTIGVVVCGSCWSTLNADVTFRVASAVSCFVVIWQWMVVWSLMLYDRMVAFSLRNWPW